MDTDIRMNKDIKKVADNYAKNAKKYSPLSHFFCFFLAGIAIGHS